MTEKTDCTSIILTTAVNLQVSCILTKFKEEEEGFNKIFNNRFVFWASWDLSAEDAAVCGLMWAGCSSHLQLQGHRFPCLMLLLHWAKSNNGDQSIPDTITWKEIPWSGLWTSGLEVLNQKSRDLTWDSYGYRSTYWKAPLEPSQVQF